MIADRLKKLREKSGLNQTQAAEKLNLSRVNYNRYENGEREPDNNTLKSIAIFFGVTTDYLLGKDNHPLAKGDIISLDHPDPEVVNLLRDNGVQKLKLARDLSLEELKLAIEIAKTIRKEKLKE